MTIKKCEGDPDYKVNCISQAYKYLFCRQKKLFLIFNKMFTISRSGPLSGHAHRDPAWLVVKLLSLASAPKMR